MIDWMVEHFQDGKTEARIGQMLDGAEKRDWGGDARVRRKVSKLRLAPPGGDFGVTRT
jgi:hypothetical protein